MTKQIIEKAESAILHTYNRFQVVLIMEKVYIFTTKTEKNIWILLQGLACSP